MEAPNQVAHVLAAFLVSLVISIVVTFFVCPSLLFVQIDPQYLPYIGIGSLLFFWWFAYVGIRKSIKKNQKRMDP